MSKTITALLNTRAEADLVLSRLELAGFSREQVSVIVSEEARGRHFSFNETDKSDEGAVTGAAIGGLTAAVYMGLTTAGVFLIPGLNLVASGALIGALAGLGAGGAVGGLVGGLVGAGIPEHEARLYEDKLRAGNILISVRADNDREEELAKEALKNANAQSIKAMAA